MSRRDDWCDDLLCWCRRPLASLYPRNHGFPTAARFPAGTGPPRFDTGGPPPPWRRANDLAPAGAGLPP